MRKTMPSGCTTYRSPERVAREWCAKSVDRKSVVDCKSVPEPVKIMKPGRAVEMIKVVKPAEPAEPVKVAEVGMWEPAPPGPRNVPPKSEPQPGPRIIVVTQPAIGLPIPAVCGRVVPVTVRRQIVIKVIVAYPLVVGVIRLRAGIGSSRIGRRLP